MFQDSARPAFDSTHVLYAISAYLLVALYSPCIYTITRDVYHNLLQKVCQGCRAAVIGDALCYTYAMLRGDRIRARRQQLGMSQQALGQRIGQYQADISRLEDGTSQHVEAATLGKLADALSVCADWLLGRERKHCWCPKEYTAMLKYRNRTHRSIHAQKATGE